MLGALGARPLARVVWPRLAARLRNEADWIVVLAPWLHSMLPVYLGLITGGISGRDLGLYGPSSLLWVQGGIGIGLGMGLAALADRLWRPSIDAGHPAAVGLTEIRWALYRAAGIGWTGGFAPGLAIGLILSGADWALEQRPWEMGAWRRGATWPGLLRAGLSTTLFAVTQNLWLILVCQVGLTMILRRRT